MSRFALYPTLQSAYRKGHSTETALLKVQNDILMNMNCKHVTLLVLLDLSAAFDTVDHDILLARLKSIVGINGTALNWFTSYLSNRSQRVSLNGCISDSFRLPHGVPQGSCLGPLLFTIYSSKLFEVIKYHLPQAHAYADDTQLYLSRLVLTPLLIRLMRSLPWSAVYWTFVHGCLRISSNLMMIKLSSC